MPDAPLRHRDQRRLARHNLSESVAVYERSSKSLLGRLVNIHGEGLMIMGNHPMSPDLIHLLDLQLPESINGRDTIPLGVDCLWSRSEDAHLHWAGCRIIDVSDEALLDIAVLVKRFGENHGEG